MDKLCGNCNFQGGSKADKQGVRILCLFDNGWHSDRHSCEHWRTYLNDISSDARVKMAIELRNNVEVQNRHQEELEIAKEANRISRSAKNASWVAIGISIASIFISIFVVIFK